MNGKEVDPRDIWPEDRPYANLTNEELEEERKRIVNGHVEDEEPVADGGGDKSAAWPVLDPAALYGFAGDVVKTFAPQSEADPAAMLFQTLTACGNLFGRCVRCEVEQTAHYLNLFTLIVGETSKARKGTSFQYVRRVCQTADLAWSSNRIASGLSSAEGLLVEVEDDGDPPHDKRLLIVQSEFASVLKVMAREGNNLSGLLRDAWDGGVLRTMVKRNPQKATGAHISMIGHITRLELLRYLSDTEAHNGFANRLLFCCARRSKYLPEGGKVHAADINDLASRLAQIVKWSSKTQKVIERDKKARALWHAVYKDLSEGRTGLLGAATSRAEPYTMRLSALYAVLDLSSVVREKHLYAALAVWNYALASARYIFGDATGDPVADRIREALVAAGDDGLSRTQISALFGRHESTERITQALTQLQALGIIDRKNQPGEGRSAEIWFAK